MISKAVKQGRMEKPESGNGLETEPEPEPKK